jgi:ABC-2 type transport system ATP-binding protein
MQSSPGGTTPRTPRQAPSGGTAPLTVGSASSAETARYGAIEARGLVKTYPAPGKTRVTALDGLTLSVPHGSIFGLVGPNGAGKSTTVKILTTLATPDAGSAAVEGIDVIAAPAQARRVIGVVGQRSGADPAATGRENLVLQGHLYGMPAREAKARADELLDRFQLTEAAGRFVRTYSGGMQRRLDVALGLVHRPRVLFLDEPTTGLDPESRAAMWDEIIRLSTADQVTVLLTTHYLDEADKLAGSLAIVDRGRVVAEGDPGRLKNELGAESLDEVYLHYAGRRYSDATRVTEVAGR